MGIILNKAELLESNSKLRGDALEILEAGLEAVNTEKILKNKIILGIEWTDYPPRPRKSDFSKIEIEAEKIEWVPE